MARKKNGPSIIMWAAKKFNRTMLFYRSSSATAILALIALLIILLQCRLWRGDGGIEDTATLQHRLDDFSVQVNEKKARNDALYAEVQDLKNGQDALEERARDELGMIKEGETFFQVVK